jgi:hypothetical protein
LRRFAVAALFPPANVERAAADIQDLLFGQAGLASAQALPPFAPLAVVPPGLDAALFAAAVAPLRAAFEIELGAVVATGSSVVLEIHLADQGVETLRAVTRACEGLAPADGPLAAAPFALGPRLWLAEAREPREAAAAARLVAAARAGAPLAFASFEYALLEVEADDGEPWWRALRWRAYGHLRTRRAASRGGGPVASR